MLAKKDICLSRCLFLRLDLAAYLHAVPLAQTHQYSRCLGPGRLAAGGEGGGRGAGEKTGIHTAWQGQRGVGGGLRKIGEITVQPDNDQTRGKIAKIGYLLQVTEVK